jgi:hypothetical protein
MSQPYRTFDLCERMRGEFGYPKAIRVRRRHAWRWGPFAAGEVVWGRERFRVWATPWFSFWWRLGPLDDAEMKDLTKNMPAFHRGGTMKQSKKVVTIGENLITSGVSSSSTSSQIHLSGSRSSRSS